MPLQTLNSAQLALAALQESDQEAFKRLLGLLLKPTVDPASFKHDAVIMDTNDPDYATTNVSIDRNKAHVSMWGYRDNQSIRFRRVSLEAIKERFGSIIRADLPATKQELLNIILSANGLYKRGYQVIDDTVAEHGEIDFEIQPGQFLLHGQTSFEVKPYQRQLQDVIVTGTIPGFRAAGDFEWFVERLLSTQLIDANQELMYPLEAQWLAWGSSPVKLSGYRYDNTSITVTAFGEGYYLGEYTVIYTRYDFGWANLGNQYLVDGPTRPTTQHMLDAISQQTGIPVGIDDVVVETYDLVPVGEVQTLTIFFKEDNLRFTGELTVDYRAN